MTRVGVGKSVHRRAVEAAHEAADLALGMLGDAAPALVIVFATAAYPQDELLRGVRERAAGALVVGCSAEGVITQDGSDEGSHVVGLMAIASDDLRFATFRVLGVAAEPRGKALELAEQVRRALPDARLLLLLADGITVDCGEVRSRCGCRSMAGRDHRTCRRIGSGSGVHAAGHDEEQAVAIALELRRADAVRLG